MVHTEERHVGPAILPYESTVPSSWWEVINKSTGSRYYWNDVLNLSQYEMPSCLSSPIQLPTSGGSDTRANLSVPSYPQTSNYSIQMDKPATWLQFLQNTNDLVPHQPHASTVNPNIMGFEKNFSKKRKGGSEHYYFDATNSGHGMTPPKLTTTISMLDGNNQKQDMRVAGASIQNVTPRTVISPNSDLRSGLLQVYSPPAGANVFPKSTLSGATNISLPTQKHTHVPALTANVPSVGKSLYLSFFFEKEDRDTKWYHFNLGGGEEVGIVKESGSSKEELITSLLDEVSQDCHFHSAFTVLNSSIYKIVESEVQVLETESRERPSWKLFSKLAMDRVQPWAVPMNDKIYIVGSECEEISFSLRRWFVINDIEVLTGPKSSNWELLPVVSPKISDWFSYFVVPFEDHNKLVMGSTLEQCLFMYNVCTQHLEKIDFDKLVLWGPVPAVVGNTLFMFSRLGISAYDLVERCFWHGTIDGLDRSFFRTSCNDYENPSRLIYLGGGKLCLICFRSQNETTSAVRCCVFDVPEFRQEGDHRSLHGRVLDIHKFDVGRADKLMDVLLL